MKIKLTALLLFSVMTTFGQKVFTPEQLKEDFGILRKALEEAHPGLYRYNTRDAMAQKFVTMEKGLNKAMTEFDFFKLVNPFLTAIKDGHTKFHRDKSPDDHYSFSETGYFPLQLYFQHGKAYNRRNFVPQNKIPLGAQIISIDQMPVQKVVNILFNNIFADGDVKSAKYQELNQYFEGYYADFIKTKKNFQIGYIDAKGRKRLVSLDAVSKKEIRAENRAETSFQLSYPAPDIAMIHIPNFHEQIGGTGFSGFLKKSFLNIKEKKISSLIIDLRDNEGGKEQLGIELYSYLSDKPFRYYEKLTAASAGPYSFAKHAHFPEMMDMYLQHVQKKGNEYHFSLMNGLGSEEPNPQAFGGKVYLLQNGRSFSVSAEFAAVLKDNNRAVIIGEESGGAFRGNTSGAFAQVSLPHTKLGLDVPLLGFYMALSNPAIGTGGIPADHHIEPAIHDILQKKDRVLDETLKIIKNYNRS